MWLAPPWFGGNGPSVLLPADGVGLNFRPAVRAEVLPPCSKQDRFCAG